MDSVNKQQIIFPDSETIFLLSTITVNQKIRLITVQTAV